MSIKKWLPNQNASIVFEDKVISYSDIVNEVVKIQNKIPTGSKTIGIYVERSPQLLFSMLAVLSSGLTYIILDISLPKSRLEYILNATKIDCILTTSTYQENLIGYHFVMIDNNEENRKKTCDLQVSEENEIAYLLYTSGTTGRPKGVEVRREALINFMEGVSQAIDIPEGETIICVTTSTFDIFFLESIYSLYKGLQVILANEEEHKNPILISKLIRQYHVHILQMTPSHIKLMCQFDPDFTCFNQIKTMMIGGEDFPIWLLKKLQEAIDSRIFNMYGPTETTIWSSISELTHAEKVDIGVPILNTDFYIVDQNMCVLPEGQPGELCIGGKGLAKGYYQNESLTREKFIQLQEKGRQRVFCTGDYAVKSNCKYFILGRIDNQIKLRGYRIEPEEIEKVILECGGIDDTIVAVADLEKNKILLAFCKAINKTHITVEELKNKLVEKLPDYMIPQQFIFVDDFLLTANGKLDRKENVNRYLTLLDNNQNQYMQPVEKLTELQEKVIDIIRNNIDERFHNKVNLDTELITVGVDSIALIKIVVDIENEFNIEFFFEDDSYDIMDFHTTRGWCDFIQSMLGKEQSSGKLDEI